MDYTYITLDRLPAGGHARVKEVAADCGMRKRLMDLGMVEGARIEALYSGFWGQPTAFFIRGAVIALRGQDACKIIVSLEQAE